jgi:stage V sporulation protein AD
MAPAAYHTIQQNFQDLGVDESHYDRIITGDLGEVGSKILLDMMKQAGSDLTGVHMDCGMEIYEKETQDTHAGGSGCGCAAVTLCSLILPRIRSGEWKRVLYLPTGALLSTVSFNEGESIPGICHGVVLETCQ